ncbi:MAG TPA: sigma-70 family RNA polymerase sigma factor [Anaerolineales bacterium]|nr:sigma-70 family RNA polymerase sigma factor [Anaerolineales bacterium]
MDESLPREGEPYRMKLRQSGNISNISSVERDALFESLFREFWSPIYRLLTRLVIDPAEAEDLALETFFRLYQRYPKPDEDFNTLGWLFRVATNLALQSIRSFKRRERYELTAGKGALEEAPENRPAEIFARNDEQRLARLALAQMNPRQAQLLIMRHSGMAYKEIAAALNLSPTSIGPLLLRAEHDFEKRYRALVEETR